MKQLYELFQKRRTFMQQYKTYFFFLLTVGFGLGPDNLPANPLIIPTQGVTVSGKVTDEAGSALPGGFADAVQPAPLALDGEHA